MTHAYIEGIGVIDLQTREIDPTATGIVVRLDPEGGAALSTHEESQQ